MPQIDKTICGKKAKRKNELKTTILFILCQVYLYLLYRVSFQELQQSPASLSESLS